MFNKDLKLNLDKKIIRKNNIPLLYKDDQWIKLFGEIEDKSLIEPKEEIIELKKVESEYRAEWRDLEREKTKMMKLILEYYGLCTEAIEAGVKVDAVIAIPERERIGRIKYVPEDGVRGEYEDIISKTAESLNALKRGVIENA